MEALTVPHFTDKDTETRKVRYFPKVTQLESDNAVAQSIPTTMPTGSFPGVAEGWGESPAAPQEAYL